MIFLPLILIEIFLRSISVKDGHIEKLFNRAWYVIPPIGIPTSISNSHKTEKDKYRVYDEKLGWGLGKNSSDPPLYFSNSQNFRTSESEYKTGNKIILNTDIITIGDSFTHGDEVIYEQSWPYKLENKSGLKVVNLGVGGYGIDQAILSYLNSDINTNYVIIGIISGDFERSTNILYRGLYYGGTKSKPMFNFTDDGYSIINQPALWGPGLIDEYKKREKSLFFQNEKNYHELIIKKQIFDFSYIFRIGKMFWLRSKIISDPIYLKKEEKFDMYNYNLKILNTFRDLAIDKGDIPIAVLLGNANSFQDRDKHKDPWINLKNDLDKIELKYLDVTNELYEIFKKTPNEIINSEGVHYTPKANELVADLISEYLVNL